MLIIKLFKPTLVITSILFLTGLAVFYYFNFVSSGFSGSFGPSSRTTEAKVYLVVALFLFVFSTILNLFGRSAAVVRTSGRIFKSYSHRSLQRWPG
jgi:hypothetical protein